jgi:hypothetical protein
VPSNEFDRAALLRVLSHLSLGNSVAECDDLLFEARVETGTFWDLYNDKVDLVPGSKGSGKSALFKLFVQYLHPQMLDKKRVLLAHGIETQGNQVFQDFSKQFEKLTASEFQDFWYVYFTTLVNEVLLKNDEYTEYFHDCHQEIAQFRSACLAAKIPDVKAPQSLLDMLQWCFNAIWKQFRPRKVGMGSGPEQMTMEFGEAEKSTEEPAIADAQPMYVGAIRESLNRLLDKAGITVWLMLDKLDEIFPRWSEVERVGLSSLLRSMYTFRSDRIRVKIFLRDDIFEHLTGTSEGFPGLTHVTARMASPLTWSNSDILQLIVKRLFNNGLREFCGINAERMQANQGYREECFYKAFPDQVHTGSRQSNTLSWIYAHCQDSRKVVAPRDVVDFLVATKDAEIQLLRSNKDGISASVFSPTAIQRGFEAMSKKKRQVFLEAEFPHFREHILRFDNGPAIYPATSIRDLLGPGAGQVTESLCKIGFLERKKHNGQDAYNIPYLYRPGFNIRQTTASD